MHDPLFLDSGLLWIQERERERERGRRLGVLFLRLEKSECVAAHNSASNRGEVFATDDCLHLVEAGASVPEGPIRFEKLWRSRRFETST